MRALRQDDELITSAAFVQPPADGALAVPALVDVSGIDGISACVLPGVQKLERKVQSFQRKDHGAEDQAGEVAVEWRKEFVFHNGCLFGEKSIGAKAQQ